MSSIVLGSTGLVGRYILEGLVNSANSNKIVTVGRRKPELEDQKLEAIAESDVGKWDEIIQLKSPQFDYFFSAFGTTRAAAGSADNFIKIDKGVNVNAAKAAKAAGVKTVVLISSGLASHNSHFLYFKTKGEIEKEIIDLKFPRTIILKPGVLLGAREHPKGFPTLLATLIGSLTHGTFFSFMMHPIYGKELGTVAVKLAEEPFEKGSEPIVQVYEGKRLDLLASKFKSK